MLGIKTNRWVSDKSIDGTTLHFHDLRQINRTVKSNELGTTNCRLAAHYLLFLGMFRQQARWRDRMLFDTFVAAAKAKTTPGVARKEGHSIIDPTNKIPAMANDFRNTITFDAPATICGISRRKKGEHIAQTTSSPVREKVETEKTKTRKTC